MTTTELTIAKTHQEAMALIAASASTIVELDFECSPPLIFDLTIAARQYNVSVLYRATEMILVESYRALKRGLAAPKETFRKRFLVCCFNLATVPAEDIAAVELLAVELGDLILPEQAVISPYTQWSN